MTNRLQCRSWEDDEANTAMRPSAADDAVTRLDERAAPFVISSARRHVGFEPLEGAPERIALMLVIDEVVAFVGIDDELGVDAERMQRVPELETLRGGTL